MFLLLSHASPPGWRPVRGTGSLAVGGDVSVELGLEYAFGARMEHVLSVKIGANGYSAVFSDPGVDGGLTAMEAGLDKGGGYGYFGVGYTHRFSTPIGSSPFVTLE